MKQFGGKITKALSERYAQSPNWKNGKFENLAETTMSISIQSMPKLLYKQFFEKRDRFPAKSLPVQPFNKEEFLAPSETTKFIWYGHSVLLIRMNNKTILIDPMLGPDAAPIAPFASKRFSDNTLDIIEELPEIDLMLLTHDHYDHLDLASIMKLVPKVKQFFVALGSKRHLEKWGIDTSLIKEFDWWDDAKFDDLTISFTPTRHFSGRGLSDRAKSLWGGWVLKSDTENIYFSGDGGYGDHFKDVGERLGPFDFGIMECGQYNENWHLIHMYPEESVQAAIDAGVKVTMPVHWAGFALAQHSWKEPVIRFLEETEKLSVPVKTPLLGELFTYTNTEINNWWENFD
ncbi:MBL fold metallo-hydrolase [Chondrinema litorale]|uniref:MBL fold metallo-hydrolase n=1 Tax=Chondrinema litorale TaxID=2994555 RepID=UPI002543CB48|nr:MBL fold metallo-hydrolase [Chondrinema litorale]UZR97406.1 MBL fold metallo-hydrolase [Chondrinema litorale]